MSRIGNRIITVPTGVTVEETNGVVTVNIDNGFGAGYLANMINHMEVRK